MPKTLHIKNLEKYTPQYKDRDLKWFKLYFSVLTGDAEFEMIDEIDKWRFVAFIVLELQTKKPVVLNIKYLQRKGFDFTKKPLEKTLDVLSPFIVICTETVTEPGQVCTETVTQNRIEKNRLYTKEKNKNSCPNFDNFWNAYPKKVSKGQAEKAWQQLKPDERLLTLMVEKLKVLKSTENWQKEAGQFIPHPATWLNAKGWNDESVVEIDQQNHIQSVDQATDLRDKQRIADKQHQRNLKQKASHPDHVKQLMHNAREKAKQNH